MHLRELSMQEAWEKRGGVGMGTTSPKRVCVCVRMCVSVSVCWLQEPDQDQGTIVRTDCEP
jgi:hypothetical protein